MPDYPTIDTNPDVGLLESVDAATGRDVVDVRTGNRDYPYVTPEENQPEDDAHRINHAFKRIDSDVGDIEMASLIGLPAFMLMDDR